MACLNTLKLEIKTVEQIFTKSHERFQVLTATVDELTCRFIGPNNRRYDIHANITVGRSRPHIQIRIVYGVRSLVLFSLARSPL